MKDIHYWRLECHFEPFYWWRFWHKIERLPSVSSLWSVPRCASEWQSRSLIGRGRGEGKIGTADLAFSPPPIIPADRCHPESSAAEWGISKFIIPIHFYKTIILEFWKDIPRPSLSKQRNSLPSIIMELRSSFSILLYNHFVLIGVSEKRLLVGCQYVILNPFINEDSGIRPRDSSLRVGMTI